MGQFVTPVHYRNKHLYSETNDWEKVFWRLCRNLSPLMLILLKGWQWCSRLFWSPGEEKILSQKSVLSVSDLALDFCHKMCLLSGKIFSFQLNQVWIWLVNVRYLLKHSPIKKTINIETRCLGLLLSLNKCSHSFETWVISKWEFTVYCLFTSI